MVLGQGEGLLRGRVRLTKRVRNEAQMERAVADYLGRTARQVSLEGCRFDVVAYDKKERLFTLVECKWGSKTTAVGHAFGQVAAYYALLAGRGFDFVDAVSKKLPHMRFGRWSEATHSTRYINVEFYVALKEKACLRQADVIRAVKKLLPEVGVIRVKEDGRCRNYLRNGRKKDERTAQAIPVKIKLLQRKASTGQE